uniref:Uncharacterized protein n=1 Tax=Romanomermis culicivorax TaxID=13658 RepID=A0A915L861_ROMCU
MTLPQHPDQEMEPGIHRIWHQRQCHLLRVGAYFTKAEVNMDVTCQPLLHSPRYLLCLVTYTLS